MSERPSARDIDTWIDRLDRAEPHQSGWREAYDRLDATWARARAIRRYCAIPAAIVAAIAVIVLHGQAWGFDDLQHLFSVEAAVLLLLFWIVAKLFPALDREDRISALLRYYGAAASAPDYEAQS